METSRYEREILAATKEFAKTNDIYFDTMTKLMLVNTIRQVRADEKQKLTQILQYTKDIRENAKKQIIETGDKKYYEGEFVAAEAIILHIKNLERKQKIKQVNPI